MCFENLPAEDDRQTTLQEGVSNPWSVDGAGKRKSSTKPQTGRVAAGAVETTHR